MKDNKILQLALVLFAVCAVVAGVLGVVYNITKPTIDRRAMEKTTAAFAAVLQADSYEEVDISGYPLDQSVNSVYKAADGSGYVVESTFSGAQGNITMVVGVRSDYTCSGISITEHSETSGLGAVAASTSEAGVAFREQFIGVGEGVTVKDIDALAGATITSTAVTNAVSTSITTVKTIEGGAAA